MGGRSCIQRDLSYDDPAKGRFNVSHFNINTCGISKLFMCVNNVTQCSMRKKYKKRKKS
jgi:hypothetical protein